MQASLVFTTINDPHVLEDYHSNFKQFGRLDDVNVIVIADRKTPPGLWERAEKLRAQGMKISVPTLDEQEDYLKRVGFSSEMVPYNSDNRRNIGYLMAYESGAEFLISIDDDNFPTPQDDVFKEHGRVCAGPTAEPVIHSETGYYNVCDMLEFEKPGPVYARGFPYAKRHVEEVTKTGTETVDVHVNAGLWTQHPDIDGISWLVNPPNALSMKAESVVLGTSTWSPVNTQNTGLRRDAIGAYYFIRMGYPLAGASIDRYGDIFSGYFAAACTKHLGGAIRFGSPVAEHIRNSHNYMNDANNEWACITLLEDMLPWLTELKLEGDTYLDAYLSLADAIHTQAERFQGRFWTDAARGYLHSVAYHMRHWVKTCRVLDGT